MGSPESGPRVTELLQQVAAGNKTAEAELVPLVYEELKRIASHYMRNEAKDHTLQTTALVHEAYLRLTRHTTSPWQSRVHFFAVAATVIRHILVDHARAKRAERRGGDLILVTEFKEAASAAAPSSGDSMQILALNDALGRLERLDARQSRIVELKFFAGMTIEEISEILGVSVRTVKRDWQLARAWLYGELTH